MKTRRLLGALLPLVALCLACGASGEDAEPAAPATPEAPTTALEGCWDQAGGGRECFHADGRYEMTDADGASASGTWRHSGAGTVATTVEGSTTAWHIERLEGDDLIFTGTGYDGRAIRAVYRRQGATAGGAPSASPLVGCWRRTTGGASECYQADGGYTMQRAEGAPTTSGRWRSTGPASIELVIGGATLPYTLAWSGNDEVTFTEPDGAAETFRRAP